MWGLEVNSYFRLFKSGTVRLDLWAVLRAFVAWRCLSVRPERTSGTCSI